MDDDKLFIIDGTKFHNFLEYLISVGAAERVAAPIFNFNFEKISEGVLKSANRKYNLIERQ